MTVLATRNDFTAIVEPDDEGGYVAFCAEVPGANGQGESVAAAIENLAEAIQLVLQVNRQEAFAEMTEQGQCHRVTIDETIKAAATPPRTRLRAAS